MNIDGNPTSSREIDRAAYAVPRHAMNQQAASSYSGDIRRFAVLERGQEYMLAKRWREQGDRNAANQLVTSHLRLAAKIAANYRGYGLPLSEIVSEGNVGLMHALNRFDPDRGFRFSTYAMWWIKAAIQEYILHSWSVVKIGTTASRKRLFFKLRSTKSKIAALESGDLRPDQVTLIAEKLGVSNQEVIDMNRRLGGDASLNIPFFDDGQSSDWQDQLVDPSPSPEAILAEHDEAGVRHDAMVRALSCLTTRERRIFEARRLVDEPLTLDVLAAEFRVSRERVRQIEARAFEKVQGATRKRVAESRIERLSA